MDKNAIKKYAVWARNELIARVTQKAEQYEITEKKTTPKDAESINGHLLTDAEKNQRKALIEKIQADGFEQVMEEVAYTWFNRFTALRFMEVNNYLPSHTRVFTNESGEFKPQILADAIQLDLEGLDMDKVFELKDANKTEELYKYLLITQCNALSGVLPRMFQKIEHYTELLLPDYLLREGSVIEQMIALIPEEDWTDQVQIIGWLYQYYNSEPKDAVFAALKKNVKISKENIPAATQLFTPDWIVRYMVENSLGRLWLEGHPNESLKSEWKYYLDEAKQEADVQKQLDEIRKEYAELKPEEIRCIDPCMGSGHILCYMFDVLEKIYEDYGYTAREAVGNIVKKNLWGLDIDERAAQLSYFAVMMKARQYDRRFFTRNIQPHVYSIEESNGITSAQMHDMGIELSQEEYGEAAKQAMRLLEEMHDAKEYGSIIHVTQCDWDLLRRFAVPRGASEGQMRLDVYGEIETSERLQMLINIAETIAQKYHIVVTNPPYMAITSANNKLTSYVKRNYPDSKTDLYAVFIERCEKYCKENHYVAMITQHSWMFLKRYQELREKMLRYDFVSMSHLGTRAFEEIGGEVVQTTAFVRRFSDLGKYQAVYCRLVDIEDAVLKEQKFGEKSYLFECCKDQYQRIPGTVIAYWASDAFYKVYEKAKVLENYAKPRVGLQTSDNNRFVRFWEEVDFTKIGFGFSDREEAARSNYKWFPYNKGGGYQRWYGNNDYIVNWENDGKEIREYNAQLNASRASNIGIANTDFYFRENGNWCSISSKFALRYSPCGFIFDTGGSALFTEHDILLYLVGLLNCKLINEFLMIQNPTINFQPGNVATIPVLYDTSRLSEVNSIVKNNIDVVKEDWDSFETSWDYKRHPLVRDTSLMNEAYKEWEKECNDRFVLLKNNEQQLNEIFLVIYGLDKEIDSSVPDEDICIRKADLRRDVRSFISYAVGCMFGRYSLDIDGLTYAGGTWNALKYTSIQPDKDAIIPICDDEYFDDDIVGRFVKFVEVVYGKETLEENLKFIANVLGGKGTSREIIRSYFINDFYSDHLKVYQKRPIYWLFDSGKKNGFKCLIYMHRYQSDTIARIRTDYVHEQQSRYRTAIEDLKQRVDEASGSDRVRLNKQLTKVQAQAEELRIYEEKIHHLADQMITIDLDDGVKHNYAIFKDVLAKIK